MSLIARGLGAYQRLLLRGLSGPTAGARTRGTHTAYAPLGTTWGVVTAPLAQGRTIAAPLAATWTVLAPLHLETNP